MSLIDLSGKVAIVTGGSRGIGRATAALLDHAGATVAVTFRERRREAEEVVQRMRGTGIAIQADLRHATENDRVIAETTAALGRLDIVVANAAIWPVADVPVERLSDDRWQATLQTNIDSVFFVCRAALGILEEGSSIVAVASTAAQRGEAQHADYAASKGAVIAFVKSLAVEAAPGVTVNCVAPGWVDTEMASASYEGDGRSQIERAIPLRRVATPKDIAGPIVFLCSGLARHVTGAVLSVNGGSVLCG